MDQRNRQRKHCTCRYLDHKPADCPYPNGCTGCCCDLKAHDASSFCEVCAEWTVHPDQHEHADEPNARVGR